VLVTGAVQADPAIPLCYHGRGRGEREDSTYPGQQQDCIIPAKMSSGAHLAVEAQDHEDEGDGNHGCHDPLELGSK